MKEAIENQAKKVETLENKFNENPNGKTAKKLSDARVTLEKMKFEYRISPEGKKENRDAIIAEVHEMATKHVILQMV